MENEEAIDKTVEKSKEAGTEIFNPNKERMSVLEAVASSNDSLGEKVVEPSITNQKTMNK
jgi:hypothetical protein